jgi:hypothetical protein
MSYVTHWKAPATTALVPEAHVRMGPTAHEPVARFKLNAWGVVTRITDAVKAAASALPVAKLASIAKPVKQAKPVKPVQRGSFAALIARAEAALAAA